MAFYFDDGIGDDPKYNDDQILTDDGFLILGGCLIDVGTHNKNKPRIDENHSHQTPKVNDPDDDWIELGFQCFYIGKK